MNNERGEAYSEILAFLEIVNIEYVNKIPNKLIEIFKKEKSDSYFPKYSLEIPIEEQDFKKETRELIALLYLDYWYETEEDKKELEKIYSQNTLKLEQELREKYNPDNIFKSRANKEEIQKEELAIVEYKESFFRKILNRIKKILRK